MDLEEVDHYLHVPALEQAHFQHSEHLECLLWQELAERMEELPLWVCCAIGKQGVSSPEIVDLRVEKCCSHGAAGYCLIAFSESVPDLGLGDKMHLACVDFVFAREEGVLGMKSRVFGEE